MERPKLAHRILRGAKPSLLPVSPGVGTSGGVTGSHSGTSAPVMLHSPTLPSSSQIIPKVAFFPRLGVGKPLDGNVTCSLAASPGDGAGPRGPGQHCPRPRRCSGSAGGAGPGGGLVGHL